MPSTVTLLNGDSIALLGSPNGLRVGNAVHHFTTDPAQVGKILRADACITDPPYNVSLDGDREWDDFETDKFAETNKVFMKWTESWARPLMREVLLPSGMIAAFCAHKTDHALTFGLEDAGFTILDKALWFYATGQVKHKMKLKPAYEPISIGRRKSPEGDSPTDINRNFAKHGRGLIHTQDVKAEDGKHPMNIIYADPTLLTIDDEELQDILKFIYCPKPTATERDYGCEELEAREKEGNLSGAVLRCERCNKQKFFKGTKNCPFCGDPLINIGISGASGVAKNFHPTVKPIKLMRRLVRMLTKPGATVIDPFMGSGTTGIACVLEGRNFIGIEREKDFFDICQLRIGKALADVAAGVAA